MPRLNNAAQLLLAALLSSSVLTACVEDTKRSYPTASTPITTIAQNPTGTALTAPVGTGFKSATLSAAIGLASALSGDTSSSAATVTQYSNGNIGLTAPNIPHNGTTDTVTFAQFFTNVYNTELAGGSYSSATSSGGAYVSLFDSGPSLALQYSDFGFWTAATSSTATPSEIGVYGVGNGTPAKSMPTTGSAIYTGAVQGAVSNNVASGYFAGLASLSANFATNGMTGSVTDIRVSETGYAAPQGSMNDITFSGTISGPNFSGTASTSGTSGSLLNTSGATGTFGGGFYGPSASEVTGVFSLNGGSSSAQIIGSFGASQSYSSANASSAVSTLSALPDGTPLSGSWNAGFNSMTLTTVSGATTAAVDTTLTGANATLVFYSNGNITLTAQDIPYAPSSTISTTGNTETVSFAQSSFSVAGNATMPVSVMPLGTQVATATGSVPGYPGITGDVVTLYRIGPAVGLQYSDFGEWKTAPESTATNTTTASVGVYAVGVATPKSQMPTTGSAVYTGLTYGQVASATGTGNSATSVNNDFSGVVSLTANFATAALTGSLSGLRTTYAGSPTWINDIDLSGTISGSTFSGTATAGTNAGNVYNITGTTGKFGGGFYGPNAKEIAGTFSLSGTGSNGGTQSNTQMIGSFGAHK
jgi:hypothetical protein